MDQFANEDQRRGSSQSQTARPFPCAWLQCGKMFNRKSDLARHFRIHTNERPYACEHPGCDKKFIQRSALTVHKRTHTGEKPHQCDVDGCRKCFSDSSSLARHRRIHTGNRPYRCPESGCGRSFCRKTTLTKHQRRTHRFEGTSPGSDSNTSESEGEDTEDRPHDSARAFQPSNNWASMSNPYADLSPSVPPHRAHSLSNLAVKMEPGTTYNNVAHNEHRYSYPDTVDFPRNPTMDAASHPQHVHTNQPLPPANHNREAGPLDRHAMPGTIKGEVSPIPPSHSSLASARIHSSPSSLSAGSSIDENLQPPDMYYNNAHSQSLQQYHNIAQHMPHNVQYQQYQPMQIPTNPQVQHQPMITSSAVPVQHHYHVPTPSQTHEMYYDTIPYREPTAVDQSQPPYTTVTYAPQVITAHDYYKPDDFAMAQNFETMTPSMRAMHGMTH